MSSMSDARRDKAIENVRATTEAVHAAEAARDLAVARAMHWGASWSQISGALSVSTQAAHRRFRTLRYNPKTGKVTRQRTPA